MTTDDENAPTHEPEAFYRTATSFKPLPDYKERPEEKTFSAEKEGLEDAAAELIQSRQAREVAKVAAEAEPTERGYRWDGGQGKPVEEHYTLEARRAADDLARVRQQEVEANSPAQELTGAIDEVRAAYQQQNAPPQPQPDAPTQAQPADAVQPQPQVEQQQPQPQDPATEIRQVLEQHPAVRNALAAELAATEQHRAAYAQGLRQSATVAAASLLANFPELAQVPTEHLQSAITAIAASNPQRAAAIDAQLGRTQSLFNQYKQAEAAQQQIQAQQMQQWAKQEDERFERDVAAKEDPATMQKVKANLVQIAQEAYGISKEDLAHAWQTQPILRTSAFQSVFLDAAKYRLAQRESQSKMDRSVPPVQRPGVSVDGNADTGVERAIARFNANPGPKTGAALLNARRLATRK